MFSTRLTLKKTKIWIHLKTRLKGFPIEHFHLERKELEILETFDYNTKFPNPFDFVRIYAYVQKDLYGTDLKMFLSCAAIVLGCMTFVSSVWTTKKPSQRAAVATYLIRRLWGMKPAWSEELIQT